MSTVDSVRYPPVCPWNIRRPPMRMTWSKLTMVHWRYPVEEVQALVPPGLTVETFNGSAWVGLVPFEMAVDVPFAPAMKRILHFPETNVRTYVRGRRGEPGVWFFSLEASSLPAVVTARAGYGVPYFWSSMDVNVTDDIARYRTNRRRWPGPAGARSYVEVEIGRPFEQDEIGDLDHFLTARWALYGQIGPLITYGKMHHEPWPLQHANLVRCNDELVAAAGLAPPTGAAVVHYSPGVNVRSGWPQAAGMAKRSKS